MIKGFKGKYRWLSNFPDCEVIQDGWHWRSPEYAYQAAKTLNPCAKLLIALAKTPGEAKKLGRKLEVREDWEDVKLRIMEDLQRQKYNQEPWRTKLLETGDAYIEETNTWNDTFWGVCNGVGENHLGKIIMKIRDEMKA